MFARSIDQSLEKLVEKVDHSEPLEAINATLVGLVLAVQELTKAVTKNTEEAYLARLAKKGGTG